MTGHVLFTSGSLNSPAAVDTDDSDDDGEEDNDSDSNTENDDQILVWQWLQYV